LCKVSDDDVDFSACALCDVGSEVVETLLVACNEDEIIAAFGEAIGVDGSDAGGCSSDECCSFVALAGGLCADWGSHVGLLDYVWHLESFALGCGNGI